MKRSIWFLAVLTALFLLRGLARANAGDDPRKWTVEDVLKQESAGSFDISPDGKWVVWVKTRPDKKQDRRVGDLYLTSLVENTQIQLTRGKWNDRSPQWSPDGKLIAFLSARDEGKDRSVQIWLINPNGGEPWKLTSVKKGVNGFHWRDGTHILFTARENPYLREKELKKKKDDAIVVGDQEHFYPVRLFQVCVKSKKVKRISENRGRIGEFAVSPDGRWVVTNEAQNIHYPYDYRIPPRQFLYDLEKGTREEIFTEKNMKPYRFEWRLDSKGFFCSQPLASDPDNDYVSVPILYYFDVASRKYERVPLNWKWKLGIFGYQMTRKGLLTSLANGPWNKLAFYWKENGKWRRAWLKDKEARHIRINAVGRDGETVVFTYSTASQPPRIKTGKIGEYQIVRQREIIRLNKWMDKKYLARAEVIHWKGALGDQVDGILYYPYNYTPGKRFPLMASIHGGPSGTDLDMFRESWASYPNLLTSKGVFVLKVNYHGSGNYGLRWIESIKGHYYEYDVKDILSGIDYVIKKGLVDPDRLGIMGWSNGAILSIQCVVETDRFKVVAPGAGDVNWTSDYGNCAFGAAFDNAYFGGPPWERPDYYVKISPLFKMKRVKTPTILFFGTEDTNVPTEQGWEHYHALQQIGRTPVRFILFPGEPHGLRKLTHQRRKMEEEQAWFAKYFFVSYKKPNEAFKKDSPLAIALKRARAKRENGLFGVEVNGVLVPEVVLYDSLRVGRFEVTRAQFAAFDPEYHYAPGTGNFPVNEVSYRQAAEYCKWLSEKTGKQYRLPTEKEMRKLLGTAKANAAYENNLDYWAGYDINPDDAKMLQPKIHELEEAGTLLKPVGSFRPVGENAVFDLGGNVAEWCTAKDGKGKVLGGSAVTPRDPSLKYVAPPLRYVGFRVIQEK